ncbi:MAG: hypothetical protein DMG40_04830 [Acidobacteria bacterium]|nr:MAG: hypothetical protein DMG40_04830 [Acidobacteriota bacterium]
MKLRAIIFCMHIEPEDSQKVITDEELRDEYVRAMGPRLGLLCSELQNDYVWLQRKWSNFQELFGKGQKRIDLLNRAASNFFYFLHRLLLEDAMLHLCRLSDPPKTKLRSGDRENLSVLAIAPMITAPELKAAVRAETLEVRKKCEFARKWRNRRLAHTDMIQRAKGQGLALPEVTSTDIENALDAIGNLITLVEDHYDLPRTLLVSDPWGATSLVRYLQKADEAIEKQREQSRKAAAKA